MSAWRRVPRSVALALGLVFVWSVSGCRRYRSDLEYDYQVVQTWPLDEWPGAEWVQFDSVFWEPDDTLSLRRMIVDDAIAAGRSVLEIGTGTGLIAILCQRHDATRVVATDINPAAVANARYNAAMLGAERDLEVRQVDPGDPAAFSVIAPGERFDLIVSNPPWEDGRIDTPGDHAFYDPGFALMDSILDGLPSHLRPGGRCLLAYGHVPAVRRLIDGARDRGYAYEILDERDLDQLPVDFLPGMLIEIRLPSPASPAAAPASGKPAKIPERRSEKGSESRSGLRLTSRGP